MKRKLKALSKRDRESKKRKFNVGEVWQDSHSQLIELGFSEAMIETMVLRKSSRKSVEGVCAKAKSLFKLGLSCDEVTDLSAHGGGWKNIDAVIAHYKELQYLGFRHQHILKMASLDGGAHNLAAVVEHIKRLNRFGFLLNDIVRIVSRHGGAGRIDKVAELAGKAKKWKLSATDIVFIACRDRGNLNLEFMLKHYLFFTNNGYRKKDILAILRRRGGVKKLLYVLKKQDFLSRISMSSSQICGILKFSHGYQNMTALVRQYQKLKPFFSLSRLVECLNSENGRGNLKQLLKEIELKKSANQRRLKKTGENVMSSQNESVSDLGSAKDKSGNGLSSEDEKTSSEELSSDYESSDSDEESSSAQSSDSEAFDSSDLELNSNSGEEGLGNIKDQRVRVSGVTMDAANASLLVMSHPLKGSNAVNEHNLFYHQNKLRNQCISYLIHVGFLPGDVSAIMEKNSNIEATKTLLRHIDCHLNSGVERGKILSILSRSNGAAMLELTNVNISLCESLRCDVSELLDIIQSAQGFSKIRFLVEHAAELASIPFAPQKLVNTLISNDNLNWLDACCQHHFDLIHLGFSHDQIMVMALRYRGDAIVRRVVNSFALLQSLGFSVESVFCLAQCEQAHNSIDRVVQSAQFLQQEGIYAKSLLAILKSQNGCQNLEVLIDSYPVLKPSFKKEELLEWAARTDGAKFLRSKREKLPVFTSDEAADSLQNHRSLLHV